MNITELETIPQDWDGERDIPFFRLTASLFSSWFCFGASVLLGSYDDVETSTVTIEPRTEDAPSVAIDNVPQLHSN
jgi:hypothetical protein